MEVEVEGDETSDDAEMGEGEGEEENMNGTIGDAEQQSAGGAAL
jgi:hypothetical protein